MRPIQGYPAISMSRRSRVAATSADSADASCAASASSGGSSGAGGRGSRLKELTDRRAKPAVYFGGKARIIDFALSNALNSASVK
mgnify:CR=1 FL=1